MEHRLANGVLHLIIRRDVLSTCVRELFDKLQAVQNDGEVRQASWRTLEVDLTGAKMIDSMGLNFVVHVLRWATARSANVRILIHDKNLDRLLRFTRMNDYADIVCV
jgi:ABC-type transporter Mla MlaB component